MDACVLADRAAVDRLRRHVATTRVLVEPRRVGGAPEWVETGGEGTFEWDAGAPIAGVRARFFPPREELLRWDAAGEPRAALPMVAPFALFGVRPCDLAALAYQDAFFARDAWYGMRRAAALVIGLDCVQACAGGFCVEVDAGPFARAPYDLDLTPLPDGRVVAAWGSAAGLALLTGAGIATHPYDDTTALALAEVLANAAASFPERPFVARARARVNGEPDVGPIVDAEWQDLGPACFGCTGCTSVCPTCSCFTVVDEPAGAAARAGGVRARVWDSCLLEGFQREASGHSPAPRPGDRVRRFWSHKLSRAFTLAGRIGCVGCGRCDVACPGRIGATAVMAALGAEPAS
jgi:formate hydrogenlyase subunit 6/NADH:ubiquinone oxidoreductase subunit I